MWGEPFTQIKLKDEFKTPIMILPTYKLLNFDQNWTHGYIHMLWRNLWQILEVIYVLKACLKACENLWIL